MDEDAGPGPNLIAATATVRAMREAGRLEPVDEALVQGFLCLAQCVDMAPGKGELWREYRTYELRLRATGGGDDDLARLLADLSAPVGDETPTRTSDSG